VTTGGRLPLRPVAGALLAPPLLGVLVYSLGESLKTFGIAVVVGSAAFVVGALLGFLFGIPRALVGADETEGRNAALRPNTNLEQVSDWLTKILIGAGLVQLGALARSLGDLSEQLRPALGNDDAAEAFALGLVLAFVIGGFLVSYLFTRLRLTRDFAAADASRALDALALVMQQLDDTTPGDPEPEQLRDALTEAISGARERAFELARSQRRRSWRSEDPVVKRRVDRTIPVFEALAAVDPDDHRVHGELGYALRDAYQPQPREAVAALTRAIERRDARGVRGYRGYEFARACARIETGDRDASTRDQIVADLRRAATGSFWRGLIETGSPPIGRWLADNGLDAAQVVAPGERT
jgi:hypothetical protein